MICWFKDTSTLSYSTVVLIKNGSGLLSKIICHFSSNFEIKTQWHHFAWDNFRKDFHLLLIYVIFILYLFLFTIASTSILLDCYMEFITYILILLILIIYRSTIFPFSLLLFHLFLPNFTLYSLRLFSLFFSRLSHIFNSQCFPNFLPTIGSPTFFITYFLF